MEDKETRGLGDLEPVSGMTLIEVLVAFVIFVLMIGALVSLANSGLETWTTGESRKDVYDRGQAVLGTIADDLRNAVSENVFYNDGRKDLMPASFLCDTDSNGAQRLRFVRGGDMERIRVEPAMQITKRVPTMYYGDSWEVAYVADSDPTKNLVYRAIRYFDRRVDYTLLRDEDVQRTGADWFKRHAAVLERGILYLGFRFWTQESETWFPAGTRVHTCGTEAHRPLVQLSAPGTCPVCARPTVERVVQEREDSSDVWDSTRVSDAGFRYRKRKDRLDPDFVYPEIVQITVVLESHASEVRGLKLDGPLGEKDALIKVTDTRGLPDAPNFVKIDAEWIEYDERTYDSIRARRRGARGTKAKPHDTGAIARFGETFVTEVRIPAFRHAVIR
ncbi:MAG: prepilin-type N-terminal cleavage/methylation domain-containing protein [Planctomycetes bacterium]|nr:prepilin-type N-terminal cleavage/methylation domain-containing protein [Planctomycetota bacterium]